MFLFPLGLGRSFCIPFSGISCCSQVNLTCSISSSLMSLLEKNSLMIFSYSLFSVSLSLWYASIAQRIFASLSSLAVSTTTLVSSSIRAFPFSSMFFSKLLTCLRNVCKTRIAIGFFNAPITGEPSCFNNLPSSIGV